MEDNKINWLKNGLIQSELVAEAVDMIFDDYITGAETGPLCGKKLQWHLGKIFSFPIAVIQGKDEGEFTLQMKDSSLFCFFSS